MKSPLFVLIIVVLGSLSFPADQPDVPELQHQFYTSLEQEAAFRRLSAWIEEHYAYSHCEYLWEQEDRLIQVRQGIGAVALKDEGFRKFSYNMNIRISPKEITLEYANLKPIKDYRNRVAYAGLSPQRGDELEWMQHNLQELSYIIENLMN